MCVCVSASCTCIVHAWLASVPEVLRGSGTEAGGVLWRRGSHPLVCAVTSVEGFLQQGAKEEDSRGERALFPLCVCLCVCAAGVASFVLQPCLFPPSPPSLLIWYSTQRAHSSQIKHRLICVLKPESAQVQLFKLQTVYCFKLYMRQIIIYAA